MRLIDADALLDEARSFSRTVLYGKNLCFQEDAVMMKRLVEMVNTRAREDFVEVVRCRHCVHARLDDEDGWICQAHERTTKEDDFCSYGEKVTE